ncbi:uncharacterized protein MELLADRAFT_72820 [Melampsora larici-populina 98AG31]|uniref:Uncharacterized protein n=1 Tax=Melampsora larici-populina (strain 98AG31 / pathotype 3-4-7) TaxID=747676 RepID=F4RZB5_MELLP|nr:uncharacterized protein MELLADRAFT_72820 [Melampsora larici-populina 98AG31]EGG02194.1 hypothetical protein MELLADRAFT_72820 [Melampsora larici-populina 98AG31]
MVTKKFQEDQVKRYLSEHEKPSVLNRTRQDLGLSPRHQQTHLDSILESYGEEDTDQEEEDSNFQLDEIIDENDDDQTKWNKVESLLSRLPCRLPDLETESESDQKVSSSSDSFKTLSNSSSPLKINKPNLPNHMVRNEEGSGFQANQTNLRKSEAPKRFYPIEPPEPKPSRKTIQVSNHTSENPTSTISNKSESSKQIPVLVPQPWGRARDQRRQTQTIHPTKRSSEFHHSTNSRKLKNLSQLEFKNKHLSGLSKSFKSGLQGNWGSLGLKNGELPPPVPGLPKRFV